MSTPSVRRPNARSSGNLSDLIIGYSILMAIVSLALILAMLVFDVSFVTLYESLKAEVREIKLV